ncbi:MAG: ABC-F family ATP-binding cassette domain-containing protein [Bacteroidales bacterium]|nr:ABC-F family ATP-binding cassette domain-containing protein [Bacteroidales bacterium]
MITINGLSVHFPGGYLFRDISFVVGNRDRIGLVGKNGAGKSTLMKVMAGKQEYESGSVVISAGQTIGYLPQEMVPSSQISVLEEALTAFDVLNRMEKTLEQLTIQIAESTDYESKEYENLLQTHSELSERIVMMGSNNRQVETEQILLGLGFLHSDFSRKMTEFSSGWQMRVELAKLLLQKPEVLLLDEPTNHLDIESIQWLENFLRSYYGAVILVSHDRTFLDNITTRTIEITAGKIYDYKTNYSEYVKLHAERMEQQQSRLNNQQKQIAQTEKFIERFRYKATKSKQVQSRIKLLEKMDKIEIDDIDTSSIHFRFPPAPHSGKVVLETELLNKNYGEKIVLKEVNILIEKGEKVAFVGKNGEGKSTLSKIIVGEIESSGGVCRLGHAVSIGYFAQNQAALLDGEKTVFETIDEVAVGDVRTRIRNILGSFLFDENDIEKKVKVLSGGEKTRLALAKLLLEPVNLLVLDEPTNHLDMLSKDILKMALMQYDGTLIVVSHDRDFLQGLTDTIYEFSHHKVKQFKGDIFDFLQTKNIADLDDLNQKSQQNKAKSEVVVTQSKQDYLKNKERESGLRKIRNKITSCEQEIETLENKLKQMDDSLASSDFANQISDMNKFYTEYEEIKKQLSERMNEWEELQINLEEAEKQC